MSRSCGDCNVCCTHFEIPGFKAAGVTCQFLDKNCSIYDQRPKACRAYRCSWLEGHGKPADRPDLSGVLVDTRETQFGLVLVARSSVAGTWAVNTKQGKLAIKRIKRSAKMLCLVTADENTQRIIRKVN